MKSTIKTFNPAADQTDAVLDIFNTPEHQARIQNARRRDYLRSLRHRLMVNGFLVALGFILGALLV